MIKGEWIELHDAFDDLVLIKRSAIIAVFKDIAGQTVVSCGDYKVKVKECYDKVVTEVRGKIYVGK